ncbi:hypothetical protein GLP30_04895 [Photobacterium phosphoreum]|uniref:Uncharacterized protein n=1 Tax=Photobacterium phosphoreum TaxID=659 RepID=A0AAW4ZMR0_PHOPO|nr:hypothetical protein [Photobacterium phosphoreum]KJF84730.1 hypothetical protein UB41_18835 [Photobacterium phosphoreum]MCD9490165.1 hypothetical protein [Photobacterium phosphoreum]MCF2189431.1 hypothetical protein [Photobacterium phosphoreum]MCF2301231.1 hypothetical protein [Photobacterium phosphoreum]PQJ90307.1 hypothetical protein BTO21_00700 [Photobacterium phosphoreum]
MKLKTISALLMAALFSTVANASTFNPIKFGESINKIKTSDICTFHEDEPSGIADQVMICFDYHYDGKTYPLIVFGINGKAQKAVVMFNQDSVNDGLKYIAESGKTPTFSDTPENFRAIDQEPNKKASIVLDNGLTRYTMQSSDKGNVTALLAFSSPAFLKAENDPKALVKVKQQHNQVNVKQQNFLKSFNGVWATHNLSYQFRLDGKSPILVENQIPYRLKVKDIDYSNSIVHLNFFIEGQVAGNIYIRKITNNDGSYYLTISVNDEAPDRLSFVRKLS